MTYCLLCMAGNDTNKNYADLVNPLMGSMSEYALSTGNTYPAVALPWGMNFFTPQTGKNGDGWTYCYTAHKISGIKQTHQPSPWINDYGQFSLFPESGDPEFDQQKRASWFSHKSEIARPYLYKVYLADYDITTEITPTMRAAMMRVTYPQTERASIILDLFDENSEVKINGNVVTGYTTKNSGGVPENFKNYFVLTFSHPVKKFSQCPSGAIIEFGAMHRGEQVCVSIASSFISTQQAQLNLNELQGRSFDQLCSDAKEIWNQTLGVVDIEDDNIDNLRTFYTCLYRSVLFPRSFYEINANGEIVHYSPYNGQVVKGYMFTDSGFWDTFRSLFPLLNLLYPEQNRWMQEGLVNVYKESGFLPEWASPGHRGCMVGNNSASIVADAYLLGQKVQDTEALWAAVVHGANSVHPKVSSTGRRGYEFYNKLGYIPYDVSDQFGHINENVARTLEYAYDDWCIYQLGKALGKSKKELAQYRKNAMNYRNVFDTETNLMRGRNQDGTFQSPFSPLKWGDAFTEGNSWHYTWSVFHDVAGLIDLMGGEATFNQMLDSVFNVAPSFDASYYGGVIHEIREMQVMNMGNYAHGNQPAQHIIYLYNWSSQPWKTQYWGRETMLKLYSPTPDGYCGDEDNGQTSAWYVFSALGFYPVCPASGEYALGAPLFKKATLNLSNGNTVTISAPNNELSTPYVNLLSVNGNIYDRNYITFGLLTQGAQLDYQMSKEPNFSRGTAADSKPYSFSRAKE